MRQSTWISAQVQAVWVTYSWPQKDCGSEYVTLSARKKIHIVSSLFHILWFRAAWRACISHVCNSNKWVCFAVLWRWLHFAPADVVLFLIATLYFSNVPFEDDVPGHTVSHSMIDNCVACLHFSSLQFKAMSVLSNPERAAVLCACRCGFIVFALCAVQMHLKIFFSWK